MKKLFVLALVAMLSACENAPSAYSPPPLTFEAQAAAPININVAKIDILTHYTSPLRRPNVEQDFVVSPVKAAQQWANQRLRASGQSGRLEVTIREASVIETPLNKTPGVKGLFTDDQDARYDAKLVVTFRVFDGVSPASRATGDVEVTRFVSINEKATVFDRQRIYHQMLDKLMIDFEREANARLRQYFSAYLR